MKTTSSIVIGALFGLLLGSFVAVPAARAQDDETGDPPRTPDCVYVPTPHDVVEKMLALAELKKGDVVYDLGCGEGRILVRAARKRGCQGIGFEIVPQRIKEAREKARKKNVDHLVEIKSEDLFEVDLSKASVLPIYLLPSMLKKLKPKFMELKPGTRIISHDYSIEGIVADEVVTITSKEDGSTHTIFFYKAPLKESES